MAEERQIPLWRWSGNSCAIDDALLIVYVALYERRLGGPLPTVYVRGSIENEQQLLDTNILQFLKTRVLEMYTSWRRWTDGQDSFATAQGRLTTTKNMVTRAYRGAINGWAKRDGQEYLDESLIVTSFLAALAEPSLTFRALRTPSAIPRHDDVSQLLDGDISQAARRWRTYAPALVFELALLGQRGQVDSRTIARARSAPPPDVIRSASGKVYSLVSIVMTSGSHYRSTIAIGQPLQYDKDAQQFYDTSKPLPFYQPHLFIYAQARGADRARP